MGAGVKRRPKPAKQKCSTQSRERSTLAFRQARRSGTIPSRDTGPPDLVRLKRSGQVEPAVDGIAGADECSDFPAHFPGDSQGHCLMPLDSKRREAADNSRKRSQRSAVSDSKNRTNPPSVMFIVTVQGLSLPLAARKSCFPYPLPQGSHYLAYPFSPT